jgi:tRNA(Ser,Leu) C12 N-acetylase TAN1
MTSVKAGRGPRFGRESDFLRPPDDQSESPLIRINPGRGPKREGFDMEWNIVVTVKSGPHFESELLGALVRFGRFRPTHFREVCFGRVDDVGHFLDEVRTALAAEAPWTSRIGRVIPVEHVFWFTPADFAQRLKEVVTPMVERMDEGSFCVRIERRGFAGELKTQDAERIVGEHVHALAEAQGKAMRTELEDPDYIIAAETLGPECGVALLSRALREKYPFVQTR